jgi:dipeptidyl aminopeptidase/acylaminoacyl peptidase
MDKSWIKEVAWLADDYLQGPIRGLVLAFPALGYTALRTEVTTEELGWAQAGGLVVVPYTGPWSWMNRLCRQFVDDLVDAVYSCYGLSDKAPLISTGGSMGGHASLLYTRYARRPVAACLARYPVCDLEYHFSERPDVPRTLRYAYRGYSEDWPAVLAEHSPLSQVSQMPNIPYLIIHGTADAQVSKTAHSDRLAAAMRQRRMNVEYAEVAGLGHSTPMPVEILEKQIRFVAAAL